ncbi:hypothetical protein TcasGA2_TC031134 [Tribolium castaneum]|uniref:Uncharacterized protein n=1 Tax=Tribolium castaneum TaxID=7070 RepID=A0A139WHM6_TRICA|nr:hypothetical protein TcasGA2_TC031134 [Tribolium castaneum]
MSDDAHANGAEHYHTNYFLIATKLDNYVFYWYKY